MAAEKIQIRDSGLTTGNVFTTLLRFSIPFLITNILQSFYNVIDMVMVGKFGSSAGISAVAVGGQVTLLVTNSAIGLSNGALVLASQYYGAKKIKDLSDSIYTTITFFLILSVTIAAVVILTSGGILRLLSTPEESFAEARQYLVICMLGMPFIFGYNAISALLRGMGDSTRPMFYVMLATASHTVFSLLFIGVFRMGPAGAAASAVIAQGASFFMAFSLLRKTELLNGFSVKRLKIVKQKLWLLLKIGFPTLVQQVLVNLSFLSVSALANSYGIAPSTMFGIGNRINNFATMPGTAVSHAIASMSGQCIGAGQVKRAEQTAYQGMILGFAVSAVATLVICFFPGQIVRVFTDDPAVLAISARFLRFMSLSYIVTCLIFCVTGLAIGLGRTVFVLAVTIVCSVGLRIPLVYFFALTMGMGFDGVGLGMGLASWGAVFPCIWFMTGGRWKKSVVTL